MKKLRIMWILSNHFTALEPMRFRDFLVFLLTKSKGIIGAVLGLPINRVYEILKENAIL